MDLYLSVAKMVEVEKASDQAGHTYPMMMACAGRSLADEILLAYSHDSEVPLVLSLVGSGNNGGDALVAMEILLDFGWDCVAYLSAERDQDPLVVSFEAKGGEVLRRSEDPDFICLRAVLVEADILLDGLLGTGIKLPLRPPVDEVLDVTVGSISELWLAGRPGKQAGAEHED